MLGTKILEELTSPINGRIKVVKNLVFGTYIQVNNLTQSGGVVEDIWRSTLRQINKLTNQPINSCLILGLGGGSAAKIVRKLWPEAKITGVDIDPLMVEMGRKYLGLDNLGVDIKIEDADEFISQNYNSKTKSYDLILVDLYQGDKVPAKFETENYIQLVRVTLARGGVAVFNRLYYDRKRPEAVRFLKKLEKVFPKVVPFYPEANAMFICSA